MKSGAKRVSVLLAVYRPNLQWLALQLQSLEWQSYPELEICIRDDCPERPVGQAFFEQTLISVPFSYQINSENLGHAKTFAKLAEEATGQYLAFCDQDDVWREDKLERLAEQLEKPGITAAYCTMDVIDGKGNPMASDIREVRKKEFFLSGEGLAPTLFVRNCIYGNTLVLPSWVVKEALPLPDGFTHDHWFSLWAAYRGQLAFVERPLVHYRIHGGNLSTPFRSVSTRQEYLNQRIKPLALRCHCRSRFAQDTDIALRIAQVSNWVNCRQCWLEQGGLPNLITYGRKRGMQRKIFCFEVVLRLTPPFLQKRLFAGLRKLL